jgi:hypothetical protein
MAIIVRHTEESGAPRAQVTPLEDGVYTGVCIGVFDVGMQHNEKFNKTSRKGFLFFEVDELIEDEGAYKGKRYVVHKEFTLSFHPKATLRKTLDVWMGGIDDADGVVEFDLESLVGQSAMITVANTKSEATGRVYTNIMNITKLPKKTEALEVQHTDFEAPPFVKQIAARQIQQESVKQTKI